MLLRALRRLFLSLLRASFDSNILQQLSVWGRRATRPSGHDEWPRRCWAAGSRGTHCRGGTRSCSAPQGPVAAPIGLPVGVWWQPRLLGCGVSRRHTLALCQSVLSHRRLVITIPANHSVSVVRCYSMTSPCACASRPLCASDGIMWRPPPNSSSQDPCSGCLVAWLLMNKAVYGRPRGAEQVQHLTWKAAGRGRALRPPKKSKFRGLSLPASARIHLSGTSGHVVSRNRKMWLCRSRYKLNL